MFKRAILLWVMTVGFFPGMVFGQLSYEGSSSIAELVLPQLIKVWEQKTGKAFGDVRVTDSSQGFQAVIEGRAVFGGLSRFLSAEELQHKLVNGPIGYDAVVIYVSPDNPIASLTSAQARDVFLGKTRRWRDIGGPDGDILLALKENLDEGGIYGQFREMILGGLPLASPSMQFPGHREAIAYVAENPLGITMGALAFDQKKAKILAVDGVFPARATLNSGEYPLARPFVLVYREDPDNEEQKSFLDLVFSREGQEIIGRHLVPVMEFK